MSIEDVPGPLKRARGTIDEGAHLRGFRDEEAPGQPWLARHRRVAWTLASWGLLSGLALFVVPGLLVARSMVHARRRDEPPWGAASFGLFTVWLVIGVAIWFTVLPILAVFLAPIGGIISIAAINRRG